MKTHLFNPKSAATSEARPGFPFRTQHLIEPIEARIAPAAVFTYTDVDGDFVTIKTSKGTDGDWRAILTLASQGGLGMQLQKINFGGAPADASGKSIFHGSSLTIVQADPPQRWRGGRQHLFLSLRRWHQHGCLLHSEHAVALG